MNGFKNIQFYKFENLLFEELLNFEELLQSTKFVPCKENDIQSYGWVSSYEKDSNKLVYEYQNNLLIKLKIEEKRIPQNVLNEELNKKISLLEKSSNTRISSDQKAIIKDEVHRQLIPRAFSNTSFIQALIIPSEKLILIDSSSQTKAEFFLKVLRKTIGKLPVQPLDKDTSIEHLLYSWLTKRNLPDKLSLTNELEVKPSSNEKTVIKFANYNLESNDNLELLNNNKYVTKIGLEYNECISFTLTNLLQVKKLKLMNSQKEESYDDNESFDTEQILMIESLKELSSFVKSLIKL